MPSTLSRLIMCCLVLFTAGCVSASEVTIAAQTTEVPSVEPTATPAAPGPAASATAEQVEDGADEFVDQANAVDQAEPDANDADAALLEPGAGYRMRVFNHVDRGNLIDGEYVAEYPEGALTWYLTLDVDPVGRYVFLARDGVAEPGDSGCYESLETEGRVFARSTFDGQTEFEEQLGAASAFEDSPGAPNETASSVWDDIGVEPETRVEANGLTVQSADLDAEQTAMAFDAMSNLGGVSTEYQRGRLETSSSDGVMIELRFTANFLGEERQYNGDSVRQPIESIEISTVFEALPAERVVPEMSLLETNGCQPPTAELPGTWRLRSLIGGDEVPVSFLDQIQDATLTIDSSGAMSGSTGCRSFLGRASVGFNSLDDVALDVSGPRCVDAQFPEGELEDAIVETLSADSNVFIDLEDRLWLIGAAEGVDQLLLVFEREA